MGLKIKTGISTYIFAKYRPRLSMVFLMKSTTRMGLAKSSSALMTGKVGLLDMRMASNTPAARVVSADGCGTMVDERYTAQPVLDVFHGHSRRQPEKRAGRGAAPKAPAKTPAMS